MDRFKNFGGWHDFHLLRSCHATSEDRLRMCILICGIARGFRDSNRDASFGVPGHCNNLLIHRMAVVERGDRPKSSPQITAGLHVREPLSLRG